MDLKSVVPSPVEPLSRRRLLINLVVAAIVVVALVASIGSLAFAGGAFVGGRLADATSLRVVFIACAILYLLAAGVALLLHETRAVRAERPSVPSDSASPPARARGPASPPTDAGPSPRRPPRG